MWEKSDEVEYVDPLALPPTVSLEFIVPRDSAPAIEALGRGALDCRGAAIEPRTNGVIIDCLRLSTPPREPIRELPPGFEDGIIVPRTFANVRTEDVTEAKSLMVSLPSTLSSSKTASASLARSSSSSC